MKGNDALLSVSGLGIAFGEPGGYLHAVKDVDLRIGRGEIVGLIGESGSGKTTIALGLMGLAGGRPGIWAGSAVFEGRDLFPDPSAYVSVSGGRIRKNHGAFQREQGRLLGGLLGVDMTAIFQEPRASLDPFFTVGEHLEEAMARKGISRGERRGLGERMLADVGLADPDRLWDNYPHALSGGMAQRVMIAMSLCARPKLLIADEPTTALDVTTQAKLLNLLGRLNRDQGLGILLISHDIGVVREICSRVYVMHKGWIVESGRVDAVLPAPKHPYTASLLSAFSRFGSPQVRPPEGADRGEGCAYRGMCAAYAQTMESGEKARCEKSLPPLVPSQTGVPGSARCHFPERSKEFRAPASRATPPPGAGEAKEARSPCLQALSVRKVFRADGGSFMAVQDVSLEIPPGRTYGLVGESGSGKTTLALALMALQRPDAGEVRFRGRNILELPPAGLRAVRRELRMLFQHPDAVLNPGMSIGSILSEGLERMDVPKAEVRERVGRTLEQVRLDQSYLGRYPGHLSSGEKQRVCIARAISTSPSLLVCDEPVASLDLVIQSQILALLKEFQQRLGMSYLFISHNLTMVKLLAARIGVMYMGRLVEEADAGHFDLEGVRHPYSRLLLASAPDCEAGEGRRLVIAKYPDSEPVRLTGGCAFRNRCPIYLSERGRACESDTPALRETGQGAKVACHFAEG